MVSDNGLKAYIKGLWAAVLGVKIALALLLAVTLPFVALLGLLLPLKVDFSSWRKLR